MKVEEGVCKYLDISMAHITRMDAGLLADHDGSANIGVAFDSHQYGYWVFVNPEIGGLAEDLTIAKGAGFSPSFRRLIVRGLRLGCAWIKLDRDGYVYDDLPQFNW